MYYSLFVSFIAGATASSLGENLFRRADCPTFKTAETTVGGVTATLTGPFALIAQGGDDDSWSGKYVHSGPPEGGCCDNFFVFGIPAARKDDMGTNFYLDGEGHLVSVQNDIIYKSFENNPDDPINAHVLLGAEADIGDNPLITCKLDAGSCALSCSVTGYSFNCLGSPGYAPDWRISQEKAGAGPGCAEFVPVAVAPVDNGGEALPSAAASSSSASASASSSSSASASASVSSSAAAKKTGDNDNSNSNSNPTADGGAATAQSSPAESANFAIRTAAPAIVANAAFAVGILAAL